MRILMTGATGYIGGRLLRALEDRGRVVRCLARRPENVAAGRTTTEVVTGDCLDEASLDRALAGVDTAYYLVHSMASGANFASLDRRAADNFGRAAARAGVRRIVYLGGLSDDSRPLSVHLRSRAETGERLRAGGVPVIEFRASVVIGAGSLSFQVIAALVERLPVMICPRWVTTLTQPIAIDDVLAYLEAALDLPDGGSRVFEIGGPEVLSYGDVMREYAQLRGLRRVLVPVPVLTPRLSGMWLALVTPAQARVGRALVDGLKNSTVIQSSAALDTFAIRPMPLRAAFEKAIGEGGLLRRIAQRAERAAVAVVLPIVLALSVASGVHADQAAPVRTVDSVDLDRYLGDWFEVARFPNRFQKQCTGDVRARYSRRPDGRLDVVNRCRTADGVTEAPGVARVVDTTTRARLKVRFAPAFLSWLPMVWGDYWILGLAADYSWAVVGSPDRAYLWILSRTATLDDRQYGLALQAAERNGFAIDRLVRTSHTER